MAECELKEIYNAIETYLADEGDVEVFGIMNAFIRSMEEERKLYVMTETKEYEGKKYNAFVMLNDEEGHVVFPLFTDVSELYPVKEVLERDQT